MDSWLNVRNQQALSHFSEEQKLDAIFRMIAESSRNPQPVCHASLEALIRGVRRLQPEDLRVSGGLTPASPCSSLSETERMATYC